MQNIPNLGQINATEGQYPGHEYDTQPENTEAGFESALPPIGTPAGTPAGIPAVTPGAGPAGQQGGYPQNMAGQQNLPAEKPVNQVPSDIKTDLFSWDKMKFSVNTFKKVPFIKIGYSGNKDLKNVPNIGDYIDAVYSTSEMKVLGNRAVPFQFIVLGWVNLIKTLVYKDKNGADSNNSDALIMERTEEESDAGLKEAVDTPYKGKTMEDGSVKKVFQQVDFIVLPLIPDWTGQTTMRALYNIFHILSLKVTQYRTGMDIQGHLHNAMLSDKSHKPWDMVFSMNTGKKTSKISGNTYTTFENLKCFNRDNIPLDLSRYAEVQGILKSRIFLRSNVEEEQPQHPQHAQPQQGFQRQVVDQYGQAVNDQGQAFTGFDQFHNQPQQPQQPSYPQAPAPQAPSYPQAPATQQAPAPQQPSYQQAPAPQAPVQQRQAPKRRASQRRAPKTPVQSQQAQPQRQFTPDGKEKVVLNQNFNQGIAEAKKNPNQATDDLDEAWGI